MKIKIINGCLQDPAVGLDDILPLCIEEGHIVAIGDMPESFVADQVIDARNAKVVPGFIDMSCHFGQLGYEYASAFKRECMAALKGGFTSVCCPPDTAPINDSEAVTRLIQDLAIDAGYCNVLPVASLTQGNKGALLSEMYGLSQVGCVAVGGGAKSHEPLDVLKQSFDYASTHNITVMIHPEEAALSTGVAHDGETAARLGLEGISELAETVAVAKLLLLAESSGVHLHLSQITTARSVEMIARARYEGLRVTADVAIQNLLLIDESIGGFDSNFHVSPPLRTEQDRLKLIEGVKKGVIDAICSHHRPLSLAAKQAPFAESLPGMSTIEMTFSLGLSLVKRGELGWNDLLIALTSGPASILGLDSHEISIGATADLVVLSDDQSWNVSGDSLMSGGKNTPWLGQNLLGKILYSLVNGTLMYQYDRQ